MKITLAPGEMLQVDFANTDGQFNVHFNSTEFPDAVVVEEVSGCTPSDVGRTGILYHDKFEYADDSEDRDTSMDDADDIREHSAEVDVGDTRYVGKHPALSAPYQVEPPHGFFLHNGKIKSTRGADRCAVVNSGTNKDPKWVVELIQGTTREVLSHHELFLTYVKAHHALTSTQSPI